MGLFNRKEWKVKFLPVWQPGDVILDTYEIENVISGGMGHVYIACYENNLATEDTEDTEKKQKNLCNLRNLWFLFFIRLRAWPRPHEELP